MIPAPFTSLSFLPGLALWVALLGGQAPPDLHRTGPDGGSGDPEIPALRAPAGWLLPDASPRPELDEVVREMRTGRFWHASRLLNGIGPAVLESPEGVLLAARAHAGWGHWRGVGDLLDGRVRLADQEGGVGLALRARAAEARAAWDEAAADYGRYLEVAAPDGGLGTEVARIRRILSLARTGDVEQALVELKVGRESLGSFAGSWVAAATARILSEGGHPDGTRLALLEVSNEAARRGSEALVARAHLAAGDTAAAREAFRGAAALMEGPGRAELLGRVAELTLALGDTAGAVEVFRRLVEMEDARGPRADAGERLLELDAVADGETARSAADGLLRAGRAEKGLEALELSLELLGETPEDLSAGLRLLRARLMAVHGSRDRAAGELLHLADVGEPSVAAPALWHLARLRRAQGRRGDARALEDRLVREHPGRAEAVDVVFFRGDDAHDGGALEGAADHYRRAVEMAPALNRSGLARMRLAQIRLEQGRRAEAADVFEGYLADFPDGRRWEEASYWAARIRLELGDSATAREHLDRIRAEAPVSYYGVLAAELVGEPYDPAVQVETTGEEPAAPPWMQGGLEHVDLLRAAGLDDGVGVLVERLSARARSQEPAGPALLSLAEGLNRRGLTMEGITLGWEVRGQGRPWDLRLLRVVYPMPYREMLVREAREWGVDPFLAAAIIRQESAFWHEAVSSAGAVGLMQVMPATGTGLARSVGPEDFEPGVLTTPEINLHLGTRFLKEMTDRFGPDLPIILSAYNAGPSRAVRWRRMPEAEDPLRFTERIPFEETRGYVKAVVRNRAVYSLLYGDAME